MFVVLNLREQATVSHVIGLLFNAGYTSLSVGYRLEDICPTCDASPLANRPPNSRPRGSALSVSNSGAIVHTSNADGKYKRQITGGRRLIYPNANRKKVKQEIVANEETSAAAKALATEYLYEEVVENTSASPNNNGGAKPTVSRKRPKTNIDAQGAHPYQGQASSSNVLLHSPSTIHLDGHDYEASPTKHHEDSFCDANVPATATGKPRRRRLIFSEQDIAILESYYAADPNAYADMTKRIQLMESLEVDNLRLKSWFQNRRRKDRMATEEYEEDLHGHGTV